MSATFRTITCATLATLLLFSIGCSGGDAPRLRDLDSTDSAVLDELSASLPLPSDDPPLADDVDWLTAQELQELLKKHQVFDFKDATSGDMIHQVSREYRVKVQLDRSAIDQLAASNDEPWTGKILGDFAGNLETIARVAGLTSTVEGDTIVFTAVDE